MAFAQAHQPLPTEKGRKDKDATHSILAGTSLSLFLPFGPKISSFLLYELFLGEFSWLHPEAAGAERSSEADGRRPGSRPRRKRASGEKLDAFWDSSVGASLPSFCEGFWGI